MFIDEELYIQVLHVLTTVVSSSTITLEPNMESSDTSRERKKNRNGHIKNINSHAINKDSISPTQEFLIRSALLKRLYRVERIRNH